MTSEMLMPILSKTIFISLTTARDPLNADVANVRLAAMQRLLLLQVDIEAANAGARLLKQQDQRQCDIADPDDADACVPGANRIEEKIARLRLRGVSFQDSH